MYSFHTSANQVDAMVLEHPKRLRLNVRVVYPVPVKQHLGQNLSPQVILARWPTKHCAYRRQRTATGHVQRVNTFKQALKIGYEFSIMTGQLIDKIQ